jgi:hypothetical protein
MMFYRYTGHVLCEECDLIEEPGLSIRPGNFVIAYERSGDLLAIHFARITTKKIVPYSLLERQWFGRAKTKKV